MVLLKKKKEDRNGDDETHHKVEPAINSAETEKKKIRLRLREVLSRSASPQVTVPYAAAAIVGRPERIFSTRT
jgi:hypothetical protein